jgi:branched-chain amino acid transport system substrate-binding protein
MAGMTAGLASPGRRRTALVALAGCGLALVGCRAQPPVRIGVLADLSGRTARSSTEARNGLLIATEEINQAGGVLGRQLQLVLQDAGAASVQESEAAARSLLRTGVDLVVGPFTSTLANRLLALFDEARVLLLCPTSIGDNLAGRDDQLVRINRTTRESALAYAQVLHGQGHRRLGLAVDARNPASNAAWGDDFGAAFAARGGSIGAVVGFAHVGSPPMFAVMRTLLASQPDGLVLVTNGVEAARLAMQAAKLEAALPLFAPDWADGGALLEIGGRAVEGLVLSSAARPADDSPRFQAFRRMYLERFDAEPSYRSIGAHDAITVVADAMARARPGETLREAVLRHGPYEGLQQPIAFNRFGDNVARSAYFKVVRNGRFVPWP